MWVVSGLLLIVWFILKFAFHKAGFVHILLLTSVSLAVVQLITDRKTRYHKTSSGDSDAAT